MSRIDLHPEDLLDRHREGTLSEKEKHLLEEHLAQCSACTVQYSLYDDFAAELEASPEDDAVVADVLDRVIPAQRSIATRRRPITVAWVAVAAAILLVTVGASATVWTVVSVWIDDSHGIVNSPHQQPQPEAPPQQRHKRPRPAQEEVAPSEEETPIEEVEAPSVPTTESSDHSTIPRPQVQPPSARELFERANRARRERRSTEAVRLFRQLASAYPGSREEVASRISLGRLLLDRLNNPGRALRLFNSYLATAPRGTLAQEARVGRALCYRRMSRPSEEARAWQSLLAHHPSTIHGERARHRLEELGY